MTSRRRWLGGLFTLGAGLMIKPAAAETASETGMSPRFPGDPTDHNVVYQFNKAEPDYHRAVLFSVSEMVRRYNDNITIVVTVFGPGIHILVRNPSRPVADEIKQRVNSLADYGVKFHACGNTMKALGLKKDDLLSFVEVVDAGAMDIMELQEQGYAYLSW